MSDGVRFGGGCPFPIENHPTVQMAHGGGGRLMGQLMNNPLLGSSGSGNNSQYSFMSDTVLMLYSSATHWGMVQNEGHGSIEIPSFSISS